MIKKTLMKLLFLIARMIIFLTFFRRSPEELAKKESEFVAKIMYSEEQEESQ